MTREDIIRMAGHRDVTPWVMKLVMDCVEAEREECAKMCARYIDSTNDSVALTALNIHDTIRAKGEQ